MKLKDLIKNLQKAMNSLGESLTVDGEPGPKTLNALDGFDVEVSVKRRVVTMPVGDSANPAYNEAKKYAGKKESDSAFGKWLSGFWDKAGFKGAKTIVGTSFAWCGLFVLAMNSQVGQEYAQRAAGARNWAKYGVAIDWKRDGIPQGAVLHINHSGKCDSGSSNHVTFADGSCSVEDLKKAGATVPGFGGNQSNQVKRSYYDADTVCAVRWPAEIPLPAPVKKSSQCGSEAASEESSR